MATARLAIRVWVRRKQEVPREERVPPRLAAIGAGGRRRFVPTDVVEMRGWLRACSPLVGGASLEGRRAGSLALAYRAASGRPFLLTSAHVVAGLDEAPFGEEITRREGGRVQRIGCIERIRVVRRQAVNRFDVALLRPSLPALELRVSGLDGPVAGRGRMVPGSRSRFLYLHDGEEVVCSLPESVETPIEVDYGGVRVAFRDCVLLEVRRGRVRRGHSGALLLREGDRGMLACGVVFAGGGGRILANRLSPVLRALSAPEASASSQPEDVSIVFPRATPVSCPAPRRGSAARSSAIPRPGRGHRAAWPGKGRPYGG